MSAPWDDTVAWRDAMLPPLTLSEALKTARKAKLPRFVYRGVEFDLRETETTAETHGTDDEVERWLAKQKARADAR